MTALLLCGLGATGCLGAADGGETSLLGPGEAQDLGLAPAGELGDPSSSGPVTLVVEEFELSTDRVHDLDGDGVPDNSIADLGEASAAFVAALLQSLLNARIDAGLRLVLHLPRVDDLDGLEDPSAALIFFRGIDLDDPPVPDDDFSGDEPFYAHGGQLDQCGEPLFAVPDLSVAGGSVSGEAGVIPLFIDDANLDVLGIRIRGEVAPDEASADLSVTGYLTPRELALHDGAEHLSVPGDLNFLEVLVTGGAAFGVALLPGLSPDVDVDGDGFERILVDDEGRIEGCLDGDRTFVPGRECWQDERFADGFSISVVLHAVGARFAGRHPEWREDASIPCADPDGGESLFDPR